MAQHEVTPHDKRAYTIDEFGEAHGIKRVKVYDEIKTNRLRAVRAGGRTLILAEDAAAWRASLPAMNAMSAAA
jgi:hypothetical protein